MVELPFRAGAKAIRKHGGTTVLQPASRNRKYRMYYIISLEGFIMCHFFLQKTLASFCHLSMAQLRRWQALALVIVLVLEDMLGPQKGHI